MNIRLIQTARQATSLARGFVQRHPKHLTAAFTVLLLGGAGTTFAVANLAPDTVALPVHMVIEDVATLPLLPQTEALQSQAMRLYRSDLTRSADTAESLLKRLGVIDPQAAAFLRGDSTVQQSLMGRSGRNVTVEASESNTVLKLVARWSPEDDGMFKRLTIVKTDGGFQSRLETLPLTAASRLSGGTIHTSLFASTDDAKIPDAVAIQIAEIFSGDIDFHRALRKGDRFSVTYETLEGDGEPLRTGRVLNTEFQNAGKTFQAMWFQDPTSANPAKGGYYNLAGESLRRAFLASPVEFSRVTSGFKMRLHPILNTWRAHLGVDYAAPTGTAVRTVGDGVVHFAGTQNGFGNVVMVKHRNNSLTVYAHLSRIHVRNGQNISQGHTVGAVGQTGWATGPHLHFEFRVNGAHRDPLTMARQSESVPVTAAARPAFELAASQVRMQLAAAIQLSYNSAQ